MTLNEILENVQEALGLESDQILVNIIVMGEYIDLNQEAESPERRRLAIVVSDELEPWTSIGMLRFAQMREDSAVKNAWEDDDG